MKNWHVSSSICIHQLMNDNLVIFASTLTFFATIKNLFFQLYKVAYTIHGSTKNINWNIINLIYLSMGLTFCTSWVFFAIRSMVDKFQTSLNNWMQWV
jgi:hypothetical protein